MRPTGVHPLYYSADKYQPPADWDIRTVKDYAIPVKGKMPKTLLEEPTPNSLPYLLIDGLGEGESLYTEEANLPTIDVSDIVIVADGSRSGLAIRGVRGVLGSTLLAYKANEGYDPDYLFFILESLYPYNNTSTIGGAIPHLDKRLLAKLTLATPKEDEQRRIAAVLKLADNAIAKAKAELEATRELKRSLMQTLFVSGMPGRHSGFVETKIGYVPKGWRIKQLGEVLVSSQYGLSESMSESGCFPILRMNNIDNGIVNANDVKYIDLDDATFEVFRLKAGDILFNRTNSIEYVGRVGIVNEDMDAVFASYLVRLTVDTSQIDPWFLNFSLNSMQVKNRYRRYATPAVQQANINPRNLKKTLFTFPSLEDSNEQQEIIGVLRSVDDSIISLSNKIIALQQVKKSLLQNLLTGKIRIPEGGYQ